MFLRIDPWRFVSRGTEAMANSLLAVALLVAIAVVCSGDVVTLSDTTWDSTMADNEFVFMKFFGPKCGFCKMMAADYERAAARMAGQVTFAELDVFAYRPISQKYGVGRLPVLKLFHHGRLVVNYTGSNDETSFVNMLTRAIEDPVTVISEQAELDAFIDENDDRKIVFGTYPAPAGGAKAKGSGAFRARETEKRREEFEALARAVAALRDDVVFARVPKKMFATLAGDTWEETAQAGILVRPTAEEREAGIEGVASEDAATADYAALESFVEHHITPHLGAFVETQYSKLNKPVLFAFTTTRLPARIRRELLATAKQFRDKFYVATADPAQVPTIWKAMGLPSNPMPQYGIREHKTENAFPMTSAFADLNTFINAYVKGDMAAYRRSEAVPEPATIAGLTTVVGSTWETVTGDKAKDVLIVQCPPHLYQCQQLTPVLKELAADLETAKLTIASMNPTENDPPAEYKWTGKTFPAIHLFPAGKAKSRVVSYSKPGQITKDSLLEFLQQSATRKPVLKAKEDVHDEV
eukprot:TRINITY_DN4881_c0_g1_i1.p1 TRINITY_DN4881_c0_g1~~TRINITY_DN4881_c0_g1_i1.p1  ORF type:complete len:526 (-),score=141.66 TRINITY_DN4881_c0_g1_i1:8-1585(-)